MVVKRELDFSDLQKECWSGAVDTLQTIWENDKEDDLMDFLEGYFEGTVPTMTEVNDLLWFEDEWIFEQIDLDLDEDDDEEDDEEDDDDDDEDDWDNDPTIDEKHDGDRFDFPERF